MEFILDIVKKAVEINTLTTGQLTYRPYVVIRKKFWFISYNTKYYVNESTYKNYYYYDLQYYDSFRYFRTYDSEEKALDCLEDAIRRYIKNNQEEIDRIVIKTKTKVIYP